MKHRLAVLTALCALSTYAAASLWSRDSARRVVQVEVEVVDSANGLTTDLWAIVVVSPERVEGVERTDRTSTHHDGLDRVTKVQAPGEGYGVSAQTQWSAPDGRRIEFEKAKEIPTGNRPGLA